MFTASCLFSRIDKATPACLGRPLFAVVLLPVLWLSLLPNQAHAQLPCIEAISATNSVENQPLFVVEEQPETIILYDDTWRGALRRFFTEGEWYFSWGVSKEWWGRTNIRISQPSQGNDFAIYNVKGIDDPTWSSVFGAQYNIRFGRFIDEARTLAVEVNFDHTKYTSVNGQTARVAGTIAGQPTDTNVRLDDTIFRYQLHNGANHLMFNLVKRVPLIGAINENFSVAAIGKIGIGPMVPHSENLILGNYNDVGKKQFNNLIGFTRGWWQINGFTTGVEGGFRVVLWNPIYLEITDKIAYARLDNVPVFQGTARHNLWMNEVVLSVGITFGGGR